MAYTAAIDASPDVAVVGGGIAGSALAALLARSGLEVVVLERADRFRDRVRGEFLAPWGVAEAIGAGLYDALTAAPGASVLRRYVPYDEVYEPAEAEERAIDLAGALPGVPGALAVGHPEACDALAGAAAAAGATVMRGASALGVEGGRRPVLRAAAGGQERTLRPRLLVGADGRGSALRAALGIPLQRTTPSVLGAGLLVDRLRGWPAATGVIGTEGDRHFAVFPRADGHARLYLFGPLDRRVPGGAAGAAARFLEGFRLACLPGSERVAAARPAGPCAAFPMYDSWTDPPHVGGAALVGDAAGASDPVIGQGLAVAIRDARVLAALLAGSPHWDAGLLDDYARERAERMRRLRLTARLVGTLRCTFGPEGRRMRRRAYDAMRAQPERRRVALAALVGPHRLPAEAFDEADVERLLSGRP